MSTNPRATVVGVFRDPAMAEQALNALKDAGFSSDQLRYSGSGSNAGSFFKSLFTGQDTTNNNFVNDLADLGVPDDETRYYADESRNGRSIVAVNAPGRVQDAMSIMQQYGAYNNYSSAAAGASQPANYAQESTTVPVNANPPVQQRNAPPQAPPPPPQTVQGNPQTADRLQELQAQLQATRKQIQDAQTQLQAAKQHEAQLQASRQHEAQVQETQKQLQDAQAQLQATLAELRATQSRINETNQ